MSQEPEVGMKCIRYMLFTTNFMFSMIGFLLISVGSTIMAIYNDFEGFMEDHFFSPASLLIAVGVIIFFVSLFGCFGAIKQSTCLINIYALLLALILVLEISASIAAYSMRGNVSMYVKDRLEDEIHEYGNNEYITESWDFLQSRLQCCGVRNSSDWKLQNKDIPDSCYKSEYKIEENLFTEGCHRHLAYIVRECATLVGTGGLCVAIVQFLGVIFAAMLGKSIRRLKTEAEMRRQENMRFYAQLARGNSAPNEKPTPVLYVPSETEA